MQWDNSKSGGVSSKNSSREQQTCLVRTNLHLKMERQSTAKEEQMLLTHIHHKYKILDNFHVFFYSHIFYYILDTNNYR